MPGPRNHQEQRASLASQQSEHISMLQRPREQQTPVLPTPTCPGCGAAAHPAGWSQYRTFSWTCFCCQKVGYFTNVCWSRAPKHNSRPTPTQAPVSTPNIKHLTISNIQSVTMEKAPLIKVCITSANGSIELEVLPDSGAYILAAEKEVLQHLN